MTRRPSEPFVSQYTMGPSCRWCQSTEQRCAFLQGCCAACSHWSGYDPLGNPLNNGQGRTREREHDTERGYHQHLYRGEMPCKGCRRAHRLYIAESRAS